LSRSRDELHSDIYYMAEDDDDDVWHTKSKLYRDHLQEVIDKWDSIDDEIWAKIIVLERNRRVAKAYARAPVLTVNGGRDGFDGFRIGVAGFDNPMRDSATDSAIRSIGSNAGFKLKMDDVGNILIKRTAGTTTHVTVENTTEETAISNDILKLPGGHLEMDKPFKVFDMKKFQQNMNRELKRPFPDRHKLECQCISAISIGGPKTTSGEGESGGDGKMKDILDLPIWIMAINIVAMEMLRTKLPPPPSQRYRSQSGPVSLAHSGVVVPHPVVGQNGQVMMRPFGHSGSSGDEDPYSVAGSGSSGASSGNGRPGMPGVGPNGKVNGVDRPPKLPPRDTALYGPSLWAKPNAAQAQAAAAAGLPKKGAKKSSGDDPYYSGLRARIPNFVKSRKKKQAEKEAKERQQQQAAAAAAGQQHPGQPGFHPAGAGPNALYSTGASGSASTPFWWHSRLYNPEGGGQPGPGGTGGPHMSSLNPDGTSNYQRARMPYITDSSDSDYSHIYGRLPIPTRSGVRKFPTKPLFLSHWE